MARVCQREGCGQRVTGTQRFCGKECSKQDKRDKVREKRAAEALKKSNKCRGCQQRCKPIWLTIAGTPVCLTTPRAALLMAVQHPEILDAVRMHPLGYASTFGELMNRKQPAAAKPKARKVATR